ncbi:hypothetical protein Tco_1044289 [Tanacetum coccineum]|uniref:BED-type domain-containing protein n=1 Tax=Tanacetum coccineum TaxID=301880 RepID=A0ABQ5GQJ7_9ASTR
MASESASTTTGVGSTSALTIREIIPTNRTPEVWKDFNMCIMTNGQKKAQCKYCFHFLSEGSNTTLKNHITHPHCEVLKAQQNQNPEAGQTSMGRDGQIFMYNPDYLREQFAGLVIQRGLPFNHFDHEQTTRVFQNTMQPRYTHVSRSTLKRDAMKLWVAAKQATIDGFANLNTRVNLTTDVWSAPHNLPGSYMCVTAHWIEPSTWQMMKRVISFEEFPSPHTGILKTKCDRLADKQSGRPSRSLPSNTQPNPRGRKSKAYQPPQARNEHVNAVFIRSGKSYNRPDNPDEQNKSETPINFDSNDKDDEPTPQPKTQTLKQVKETPLPKPYKPKILRQQVPLILGQPFLHTADAVTRVKQKQINLGVRTKQMIFNFDSAMKHSYSNDDTCFSIDVIDEILEEDFDALLDEGSKILYSIKGTLLKEEIFSEFDKFIAMAEDKNYESKSDTEEPPFEKITINTNYKIKTSLEEPPTNLEL